MEVSVNPLDLIRSFIVIPVQYKVCWKILQFSRLFDWKKFHQKLWMSFCIITTDLDSASLMVCKWFMKRTENGCCFVPEYTPQLYIYALVRQRYCFCRQLFIAQPFFTWEIIITNSIIQSKNVRVGIRCSQVLRICVAIWIEVICLLK